MHIVKDSAQPIYLQIIDQITSAIEKGQYRPGDKVPSTRALSQQLGVSRMTVLQALHELINQGRLFTVAGKGTFVGLEEKFEASLETAWSFTEHFRSKGYKTSSQLILCDIVPADERVAGFLKVAENTSLNRLVRKRLVNDQPLGVETSLLVQTFCPGLARFNWNHDSLYAVLKEHYGLHPIRGFNYFEAVSADEMTAHFLSIPRNSPVLATERITYFNDHCPIEYTRAFYRADRIRLKVEMAPGTSLEQAKSKIGHIQIVAE